MVYTVCAFAARQMESHRNAGEYCVLKTSRARTMWSNPPSQIVPGAGSSTLLSYLAAIANMESSSNRDMCGFSGFGGSFVWLTDGVSAN
jgi:hypothetical protein